MLYSKLTNSFYTTEIHGDNIPGDCVEITTEYHAALLEGQSSGKIITSDENGYPILSDPPPAPPYIPSKISMRQFRLQLLEDGDLDTVDEFITSQNNAAKIEWEYATEVKRDDILFQSVATLLNKSESEIDTFFTLASEK